VLEQGVFNSELLNFEPEPDHIPGLGCLSTHMFQMMMTHHTSHISDIKAKQRARLGFATS